MKIKSLLCGSAALAAIALVAPAAAPGGMGFIPAAQAQDFSISFGVFYDSLEPHGRWVNYDDDYVFIPTITYDDWRPYKYGHWIYARDHGWTWVSDEPFGWATYHYGRWGYDEEIGWYWVPGRRWAPAWVSWRRSGDHVAWAPIPHRRGYDYDADVSISISFDSVPDYYWVACPTDRFLDVNLAVVIIDDDRRRRVLDDAEFVGHVRYDNNVVVNNVININYIEERTGKDVREVEVRRTKDPREAKADDNEVRVFDGTLETDRNAKPKDVAEVEDVKKNRRNRGGDVQRSDQAGQPSDDAKQSDQAAEPKAGDDDQLAVEGDDESKKRKPRRKRIEGESDDLTQEGSEPQTTQQPEAADEDDAGQAQKGERRKRPKNEAEAVQDEDDVQTGQTKRKRDRQPQQAEDDAAPAQEQEGQRSAKQRQKGKQKEQPCEAGSEDCPAQN